MQNAGGSLLADYGSFALWSLPAENASLLAGLQQNEVAIQSDLDRIWLRGGKSIQPLVGEPAVSANLRQSLSAGEQFWMVQFVGPIQDEWLQGLQDLGLQTVSYLPNNAYVVWGDQAGLKKLEQLASTSATIQWTGAYHPEYRLSPGLQTLAASSEEQWVDVTVQFFHHKTTAESLQSLLAIGGKVYKQPDEILEFINISLQLPASRLVEVANWPDVFNVEPWSPPQKTDEVQNQIIAGNVTTSSSNVVPSGPDYLTWLSDHGFPTTPASYPIIDVVDDGIDQGNAAAVLEPDFYQLGVITSTDRVEYIQNCTSDATGNGVGGHGHLNASIVGAYNNRTGSPYEDASGYQLDLGVSPYGRLAGTKIFANSGYYDISRCGTTDRNVVAASYLAGATITTNSWGAPVGGAYDSSSQAYDALTRDAYAGTAGNQEMLHIFSAGNDGNSSNTIGSPGTAKNVLTVGATENVRDNGVSDGCAEAAGDDADDLATFSSRGPTDDSRVKPDLVAPGTHVQGAASKDAGFDASGVCAVSGSKYYPAGQTLYTWSSGTSHSTPAVAGAASLAYEYYGRVLNPGQAPSPAMLKALLLNTPRYLNGSGTGDTLPSNNQGWGDVNLGALFNGTSRQFYDQRAEDVFTATGQERLFTGMVSDDSQPFNVTLVWTDAPGATTGNAYVNNLDLEVTAGGNTYRGNVFSGAYSASGGSADARNNVENVFLPAGVQGEYSVRVIARNIAGDGLPANADTTDQDFALIINNGTSLDAAVLNVQGIFLQELAGNHDGIQDPNETYRVDIPLKNSGVLDAVDTNGTLALTSGSASLGVAVASYDTIPGGTVITNTIPYSFTIGLDHPCGEPLNFDFTATYNLTRTLTYTFELPTGQAFGGTPVSYSSSDVPKAIPDNNTSGVNSTLAIIATGEMFDVNVFISDVVHTYDGDLSFTLTSPANSSVLLISRRGSSGDNFTNTVLDDSATTPIGSGTAPFTGNFRPDGSLAVFYGEPISGTWTINVADYYSGDTGTLNSWGLEITPRRYSCNLYMPSDPPVTQNDVYTTTEDSALEIAAPGVLANDTDPEGQSLSSSLLAAPQQGVVNLAPDGGFVYTPTMNFNGVDFFTYLASDGVITNTGTTTITVTPVNDPPIVQAGSNQQGDEGDEFSFTGSFNDLNSLAGRAGSTTAMLWDFGDGGTISGTLVPTHTFQDDGVYTVTLTITDSLDGVGSDQLLVRVNNVAPTLAALPDQQITLDQATQVAGSLVDPGTLDGHTLEIAWGDGLTETLDLAAGVLDFNLEHTYLQAGQYTVVLDLGDEDGGKATGSFTVSVIPAETRYKVFIPYICP